MEVAARRDALFAVQPVQDPERTVHFLGDADDVPVSLFAVLKPVVEFVEGARDDLACHCMDNESAADALEEVPAAFVLCPGGVIEDKQVTIAFHRDVAESFPLGET